MTSESAEKLLRKIEVKRLFEKPDAFFSPAEIHETVSSFIRLSLESGDWRFLNAALKLNNALRALGRLPGDLDSLEADALNQLRKSCGLAGRATTKT